MNDTSEVHILMCLYTVTEKEVSWESEIIFILIDERGAKKWERNDKAASAKVRREKERAAGVKKVKEAGRKTSENGKKMNCLEKYHLVPSKRKARIEKTKKNLKCSSFHNSHFIHPVNYSNLLSHFMKKPFFYSSLLFLYSTPINGIYGD